MSRIKNWYVITGAPGTGKSTLIAELNRRGYAVLRETGRILIDEALQQGMSMAEIQVDSPEFELRFVAFQHSREAKTDKNTLTFLDRGIFDTLPYFQLYGWKLAQSIKKYCMSARYNPIVFLLEPLGIYESDAARVEDEETSRALQKLAGKAYSDNGYTVIKVGAMPVSN